MSLSGTCGRIPITNCALDDHRCKLQAARFRRSLFVGILRLPTQENRIRRGSYYTKFTEREEEEEVGNDRCIDFLMMAFCPPEKQAKRENLMTRPKALDDENAKIAEKLPQ